MIIEVVTHYPISDPEFHGDYWDIELFVDDKLLLELGDDYHDKGQAKVEGILEFLNANGTEYTLDELNVADR